MKIALLNPTLRSDDNRFNLDRVESLVHSLGRFDAEDLVLLPERFFLDEGDEYDAFVRSIAREAGCTVVGGSHHGVLDGRRVNFGRAVNSRGETIATYSKIRPYFNERERVSPGSAFGEFQLNGKNILVLVCADFWFSDLFQKSTRLPDLVLVPALSVSRKASPDYSRSLWRHLSVTRAYEFGVYVGISDWSRLSSLPPLRSCGVGGLADPTCTDPDGFYAPVADDGIATFPLDFDALEKFREDRRMRGFFWK